MKERTGLSILYHVLFWSLIWSVPFLLLPMIEPWESHYADISLSRLAYIPLMTGSFYFNLFVLYPRYMARKYVMRYVLYALLTALAVGVVYCAIFYKQIDGPVVIHILLKSAMALMLICCSSFYKVIVDKVAEQRLQRRRETENLRSELSFLRSQISPHFMFNVLNTMVSLIRQKSDKLEPVVIKLSNLMRYMLYESDEESVSLKTELSYLQSYIDLQMQRFGDYMQLTLEIPADVPDRYIEPMLLIPLVENAFKHGCHVIYNPEIHLRFEISQQSLTMHVHNRFLPAASRSKDSGIGLANLRRRLDLLYPDRHTLNIVTRDDWFKVTFKLQFKEDISLTKLTA